MEPPSQTDADSGAPERHTVLLHLAYVGTRYRGFQQQSGVPTVAGELERALSTMDPSASRVIGSSRTDAGVHARYHPVTFDTRLKIKARSWVLALAAKLPEDIVVVRAAAVPLRFDPRRRAVFKRYRYSLLMSRIDDPFLVRHSWRIGEPLDLHLMQEEAVTLIGQHDFAAFRSAHDARTMTVRSLKSVSVERDPADARLIHLKVEGDRFLYNMVRIIAGSLVDLGRGKLPPGALARALQSQDRLDLGMTAPAHGLCLDWVELDHSGEGAWPE